MLGGESILFCLALLGDFPIGGWRGNWVQFEFLKDGPGILYFLGAILF